MIDPIFGACALVSLVSAVMVVTRKNPVYSALWLMQCFLAFAVIFFSLGATFVGAMHILVYTGAILVLFLFVIMLLNLKEHELGSEAPLPQKAVLLVCVALTAGALGWSGYQHWKMESGRTFKGARILTLPKREAPKPVALMDDKNGPLKGDDDKPMTSDWGGVKHVGRELFYTHAFPFEILSMLIIVAVFGGVVLAKRKL